MDRPDLILAGPQIPWPARPRLDHIRLSLLEQGIYRPILDAVNESTQLWSRLCTKDDTFSNIPAQSQFPQLQYWLRSNALPRPARESQNSLLMPLTILDHAVNYMDYLRSSPGLSHSQIVKQTSHAGIHGFCVGHLTASSLACAGEIQDFMRSMAIALRLSCCIGAYTDLRGVELMNSATPCSVSVRWKSSKAKEKLHDSLGLFPEVRQTLVNTK